MCLGLLLDLIGGSDVCSPGASIWHVYLEPLYLVVWIVVHFFSILSPGWRERHFTLEQGARTNVHVMSLQNILSPSSAPWYPHVIAPHIFLRWNLMFLPALQMEKRALELHCGWKTYSLRLWFSPLHQTAIPKLGVEQVCCLRLRWLKGGLTCGPAVAAGWKWKWKWSEKVWSRRTWWLLCWARSPNLYSGDCDFCGCFRGVCRQQQPGALHWHDAFIWGLSEEQQTSQQPFPAPLLKATRWHILASIHE